MILAHPPLWRFRFAASYFVAEPDDFPAPRLAAQAASGYAFIWNDERTTGEVSPWLV
jgi:hypothetical protein